MNINTPCYVYHQSTLEFDYAGSRGALQRKLNGDWRSITSPYIGNQVKNLKESLDFTLDEFYRVIEKAETQLPKNSKCITSKSKLRRVMYASYNNKHWNRQSVLQLSSSLCVDHRDLIRRENSILSERIISLFKNMNRIIEGNRVKEKERNETERVYDWVAHVEIFKEYRSVRKIMHVKAPSKDDATRKIKQQDRPGRTHSVNYIYQLAPKSDIHLIDFEADELAANVEEEEDT